MKRHRTHSVLGRNDTHTGRWYQSMAASGNPCRRLVALRPPASLAAHRLRLLGGRRSAATLGSQRALAGLRSRLSQTSPGEKLLR